MNVQFEYADKKDLAAIVAIYNQAILTRHSTADLEPTTIKDKETWLDSFNRHERPIWKIIEHDKVVGWVALEYFYGRPAYLHTAEISLYLDHRVQHHGLGQQAIEFVITQLASLKIDTLVAYVFGHNTPSLRLFHHNNFAIWGNLPKVALIDGQKRDLIILGRHFN